MLKNGKQGKLAVQILPGPVWEAIEPLIPNLRPNPKNHQGRKPVPHREALSGILYVLRTGVSWEELPLDLGWGTGMTCWRRVRALQKARVWPKIVQILVKQLPDGPEIPFDRMKDFRPRGPRKKRQADQDEKAPRKVASKGKANQTLSETGFSHNGHAKRSGQRKTSLRLGRSA